VVLVAWLLSACGGASLPDLPPGEIVARSAERMQAMPGFHFLIERSGAPAFIDPQQTLSFRRAEGIFVAPDRVNATVRVIAPGMVAEVSVISIGDVQWETNLLTGEWQELPPDWGFNPGDLFDAESGIQTALTNDLSDVSLDSIEELEELPGLRLYRITASMEGDRLSQVSYGMIGPEPVEVVLWIAPWTYELHRVTFTEPGAQESTMWQIDFWDFDQTVDIEPPTHGGG
jgi:lipoprotein LprG